MDRHKSPVLCLIPCYNESNNLPSLLGDIRDSNLASQVDFLFVDDCSRDATYEVVRRAGYNIIRHDVNKGYGGAVKTGLNHAIDEGYSRMVLFPGDHQRSAKDVIKLIKEQERTSDDVVVGSKFHIYSEKYGPIRRRIGNRLFSFLAKKLWGSPIEDVLSGFKIYDIDSVKAMVPFLPDGYPLDIVFSYYSSRMGLKISEIPVECRYSKDTTKMKSVLIVSFKMLYKLVKHALLHPLPQDLRQVSLDQTSDS